MASSLVVFPKKRRHIPKEQRQNLKNWADGPRETVLAPHIEGYADARVRGWRAERAYWAKVCTEYHARISWRLSDSDEPPLPLPPYDPNAPVVVENLSLDDQALKLQRTKVINDRIRRWLQYRVRKLQKRFTSKTDPRKNPYAVLMAKLSGLVQPPKARQAYQQFMRECYREEIDPAVKREWAKYQKENNLAADIQPTAAFRAKVSRDIFKRLPPDRQLEFAMKARDEAKVARDSYDKELQAPVTLEPEKRQKCIDNLPNFLLTVFQGIQERTGFKFFVMYGGPSPRNSGEITAYHVNYGFNSNDIPYTSFKKEAFKNVTYPTFKAWLKTCYTQEDVDQAALCEDDSRGTNTPSKRNESDSESSDSSDSSSSESEDDEDGPSRIKKQQRKESAPVKAPLAGQRPPAKRAKLSARPASTAKPSLGRRSQARSPKPAAPAASASSSSTATRGHTPAPSPESARNPDAVATNPRSHVPAELTPTASSNSTAQEVHPRANTPSTGTNVVEALPRISTPSSFPPSIASQATTHQPELLMSVDAVSPARGSPQDSPPTSLHSSPTAAVASQPPAVAAQFSQTTSAQSSSMPSDTPHSSAVTALGLPSPSTSSSAPSAQGNAISPSPPLPPPNDASPLSQALPPPSQPASSSTTTPSLVVPDPLTQPSAPTVIPECPTSAAAWFQNAFASVTARDLGPDFHPILDAFITIESTYNFCNPKTGLPATNRPPELHRWIGAGRWRGKPPVVTDPAQFSSSWWRWWSSLQPTWRERALSGRPAIALHGDEWSTLEYPGQNGILSVVATLYWWGCALENSAPRGPGSRSDWLEAVRDVTWMLQGLSLHIGQ